MGGATSGWLDLVSIRERHGTQQGSQWVYRRFLASEKGAHDAAMGFMGKGKASLDLGIQTYVNTNYPGAEANGNRCQMHSSSVRLSGGGNQIESLNRLIKSLYRMTNMSKDRGIIIYDFL